MRRGIDAAGAPPGRHSLRFFFTDDWVEQNVYYLVIEDGEGLICPVNPGYEVALSARTDLQTLTDWWMGRLSWDEARRTNKLVVEATRDVARDLPNWFRGYAFAAK